ncbi:MAG: LTA synthase family protein [Eggerthellaceae bacterium]|nr:LTA synthase family protein [Eggerthellaceae bacterium]
MGADSMVIAPAIGGLIPLAGALILVFCGIVFAQRRIAFSLHPLNGSVIWLLIYIGGLLWATVMCFRGLYAGPIAQLVVLTVALTVFGVVSQLRDGLIALPPAYGRSNRDRRRLLFGTRDLVIMGAASVLAMLALETPWNDWVNQILLKFGLIEFTIVLCMLSTLYFLNGRRGILPCLGVAVFSFIGVAQYFVYSFKVAPILPSDVLVMGTAMAVSGNYDYIIDAHVLTSIICAGAAMCLLAFAVPERPATVRHREQAARVALSGTLACACLAMLGYFVTVPDYAHDAGVHVDSWFTYDSYKEHGFLTTFITVAQDMIVEKPEGYTKEGTQKLVEEYADEYRQMADADPDRIAAQQQFEELRPCVVAIMNETFSDLSVFEELHAGYAGPQFFKNDIGDTVTRGKILVSVNGGGTCNSEFEFLTGNTMAFFGAGMYPYSTYKFDDCQGLARQFDEMGYTTTAMHPNYATNWGRDVIYQKMGFQTFLSMDDFPDADKVHNEVSDAATYDKVLELLETDDSPQFIFDVTMQNHSGYSRGDIPEEFQTDYVPEDWGNEDEIAALNEYLGCMESSDAALRDFLEALEDLDRPVVVVFFGDHQPGFSKDINEAFYDDDGSAEYVQRVYETDYIIWANYDVEGAGRFSQDNPVSASNLSAVFMDAIGAPLSSYQMAQLMARQYVPSINLYGFSDSQGNWYLFEDASTSSDDSSENADEHESADEGVPSNSGQDAPVECVETIDMLERAQYERFIDK